MKKVLFLLLTVSIAFSAWAGGTSENGESEVIEIAVAYSNQPGEPVDLAVNYWAEILKEKSNGTMIINPFPSGQLGDEEVVQQQARMGANVISIASYGSLADLVPDLGVVNAPYVGTSVEQKMDLIKSDRFQELIGQLDEKGLHAIITDFYYGTRQLLTTEPVRSPSEMNGTKIRVQTMKLANYWAKAIGAVPTPMALSEAYTAMSQGIVNGIENPPATLYGGKFYEQAKYLILTNHDVHLAPWVMGTAFWNTLSQEQQGLLAETGEEMAAYATDLIQGTEQEYIDKLVAEGVEVITIDFDPYLENALTVMEGNFPEWSEGLYEETLRSLQ